MGRAPTISPTLTWDREAWQPAATADHQLWSLRWARHSTFCSTVADNSWGTLGATQRSCQHSEVNFTCMRGRCADAEVGLSLWHHATASCGCCLACWLTVSECPSWAAAWQVMESASCMPGSHCTVFEPSNRVVLTHGDTLCVSVTMVAWHATIAFCQDDHWCRVCTVCHGLR